MRSRKIRLRDLFKPQFMDKALALYGFERINNYPFLEEHLRRYLNTLRGASNFSLFNYGETYYEVIPLDADNFYEVCWNIPMARRLIMHHRLPRQEFLLGEIIDLVDRNCINTAHLDYALHNDSSIFLAYYPALVRANKLIIIDGNHRVTSRYLQGQKNISGYVLPPYIHLGAMVGQMDRTLYKIHSNYYHIACYMGGKISEQQLGASLYPL